MVRVRGAGPFSPTPHSGTLNGDVRREEKKVMESATIETALEKLRVWLRWRVRSGNPRDDPTCVTGGVNAPVLLCQVEGEVLRPVSVRTHGS